MKNTVGHTGIYAWGDCVRHRFFQKLRSNRRTKNPLPLGMGSVNNYNLDNIKPDENYAVINSLKDKRFVVVDKDLGNTTRVSYVFHDKDGNELFTITDVGNRDLYVVTIDGSSKTYLMHDDTKLRKALGQ